MQLSKVSLQAFITPSAPTTVCCSGCAELLVLALCFKAVDLDVFFSRASLQPLVALCT